MEAIIIIDFGTTASAAEYFITSSPDDFLPVKRHKFDKTPTQLLYGVNGELLAWGLDCKNDKEAKRCFKSAYATTKSAASKGRDGNAHSGALKELKKWVSDYLACYCGSIVGHITQNEHTTLKDLNVTWYLTTPGCWSELLRADFRLLVDDVLGTVLPGSKVSIDLSESEASCEFLADYLQLPPGTWAITCDIGGATCDTALAIIGHVNDVLKTQIFPISGDACDTYGVEALDVSFTQFLTAAMDTYPTDCAKPSIKEMAENLVKGAEWERARHAFDGFSDVILTADRCLGSWKDPTGEVSIDGSKISISRLSGMIKRAFEFLLEPLCADINYAIRYLEKNTHRRTKPQVIALCGGGSTMVYLLERLRARFPGMIKAPSTTEEYRLATVTGHAIYRMRRTLLDEYLTEIIVGYSSSSSTQTLRHMIRWQEAPTQTMTFNNVSRKPEVQHYVIIHFKSSGVRPASVGHFRKNPRKWKGILVWALNINLGSHSFLGQKYTIVVVCKGRSDFGFKAYGQADPLREFEVVSDVFHLDAYTS